VVISTASAKVLATFLEEPQQEQYGFRLMRVTGVKSGTLYPLLDRLERIGWIKGYDEAIDEQAERRPRRRLYRLTSTGVRDARVAVEAFYRDLGPLPRWLRAPGSQSG
jgi:DNA-binding PadR family transcriptional regulator